MSPKHDGEAVQLGQGSASDKTRWPSAPSQTNHASQIFQLEAAPSNFPSAPKVITSSDLETSQPVIFSELLNRAARAKQATNWGQHQTKIFPTDQNLLQANSPRTMTST